MNSNIKIINTKKYKGEKIGDIKIKSTNNFKPIKCPKKFKQLCYRRVLLTFLVAANVRVFLHLKILMNLIKKKVHGLILL